MEVNLHIRQGGGEKTAVLTCNWCGEPHLVKPSYRDEILARGAERLANLIKDNPDQEERLRGLKPEDTWTCGRCYLYLSGMPSDALKTECHEHPVPKKAT